MFTPYIPFQLTYRMGMMGDKGTATLLGPPDAKTDEQRHVQWSLDTSSEVEVLEVMMRAQQQVATWEPEARILPPQHFQLPAHQGFTHVVIIWAEPPILPHPIYDSDLKPGARLRRRAHRAQHKK